MTRRLGDRRRVVNDGHGCGEDRVEGFGGQSLDRRLVPRVLHCRYEEPRSLLRGKVGVRDVDGERGGVGHLDDVDVITEGSAPTLVDPCAFALGLEGD